MLQRCDMLLPYHHRAGGGPSHMVSLPWEPAAWQLWGHLKKKKTKHNWEISELLRPKWGIHKNILHLNKSFLICQLKLWSLKLKATLHRADYCSVQNLTISLRLKFLGGRSRGRGAGWILLQGWWPLPSLRPWEWKQAENQAPDFTSLLTADENTHTT